MTVRKLTKTLLWSSAAVGVVLAVLLALLFFIDVNLFRAQIERQVSTALGRAVVLEGPLTLERSLMPRFTIGGLKIANPSWASRPHLASVDEFGIRVSLLPLLDGKLEILSLEFEGVDLLIEVTEDGQNNVTFDRPATPGGSTPPPAIEQVALRDVTIGYRLPGFPARSLLLEQISGSKVPGEPVILKVETTLNTIPLALSLRAVSGEAGRLDGPWDATLLGEIGRLSLRAEGRIEIPAAWDRGQYQVHIEGPDLDDLETLSGLDLPDAESYELDARVGFDLDDYLQVTEFKANIGDTDLQGSLEWDIDAPRPAIKARLQSQRLDVDDLGLDEPADDEDDWTIDDYLNLPLDPSLFAAVDLDVQVAVGQLEGFTEAVRDVVLELYANNRDVRLGARARQADVRIKADARLPWGERISAFEADGLDLRTLLKYTVLDGYAEAADSGPLYQVAPRDQGPELTLIRVEVKVQPDEPVLLRAAGQINGEAVEAELRAAPSEQLLQVPLGPWKGLELAVRSDVMQIDVSGSVARPFEAGGLELGYRLKGPDLAVLVPLHGRFSLNGRYRDQPGRRLFEDLQLRIGDSDLQGRIVLRHDRERPQIVARLSSERLRLDQLQAGDAGQGGGGFDPDLPIEIGDVGLNDLDIELRVQALEGVGIPVRDVLIGARSSGERLSLAPIRATVDDSPLEASLTLPWGRRLTSLGLRGVTIPRLLRDAELSLRADLAAEKLRYQTRLLERDFALELIGVEATASPGGEVQLLAQARLGDKPFEARLQAEPLEQLLARPQGPWRDLGLKLVAGDIRFEAEGKVERPFDGAGFDLRYELRGAEIDQLLPLFDLMLPMEGAYAVSGHFMDLPDRIVLDDLKIVSGRSDIGGQIMVHRDKERPRVEAKLTSDQIYLRELLPVNEDERGLGQRDRVIPDYDLPIESMRAFDGELLFRGKRLRTEFGDIGDISFRVSLQDGLFRISPFRVHGWEGALVTADLTVDAAQEPPLVNVTWVADDLNYGLLLRQAGVAEIVEGTLDVTLRLSGKGRTRHELLADADGDFVIVGKDGRVGSRRLDLWGAGLVTTMLSPNWRAADVTKLNCLVLRATFKDGIVISDDLLVDTQRITIGAAGTLDLETEALEFVFAPRPKRASLVSLTNPVSVGGTLSEPEVSVTVLPAGRVAAASGGLLAGLVNPAYLLFALANTGSGETNPCLAAVNAALDVKAAARELEPLQEPPPEAISPLSGCSPLRGR